MIGHQFIFNMSSFNAMTQEEIKKIVSALHPGSKVISVKIIEYTKKKNGNKDQIYFISVTAETKINFRV